MLKCKVCNFESSLLDEVTYYDINGNGYFDDFDIERNSQNPDALTHTLCTECVDTFDFS